MDAATPGPWEGVGTHYHDEDHAQITIRFIDPGDHYRAVGDHEFVATFNPQLVAKLLYGLEVLEEMAKMSTASGVEDWARDVLNSITSSL